MSVTDFRSNRMTEQDYDRARAELGNKKDAGAKWDQQLAALFYQSGWTQEELAKKETQLAGKKISQSYISRRLLFGRFLNFMPMGIIPKSLTERRFRDFWEATEGVNEPQHFAEVQKLLADSSLMMPRRPAVGRQLVEQFGNGKWHSLKVMAEALDADENHIEATLDNMLGLNGTYGAKCERKKVGKSFHYRMFSKDKQVSSQELTEKLGPIIDALREEGRKNMATMSPATVANLAHQLRKIIDGWTK